MLNWRVLLGTRNKGHSKVLNSVKESILEFCQGEHPPSLEIFFWLYYYTTYFPELYSVVAINVL